MEVPAVVGQGTDRCRMAARGRSETDRDAYVRGKEDMITEFLRMSRGEGPSSGDS